MVYKNISVKTVIAKVMTDLDMREETHRISDMVEWAGEAMEKIGAFPSLDINITGKDSVPFLELSNYQVALPTGLHNIVQAAYASEVTNIFRPMRSATGSFDASRTFTMPIKDDQGVITGYEDVDEKPGETDFSFIDEVKYSLKPGYMVCSQKEGYVMLAYTSIPVDEEGYPMIPDDIGFKDALYWYITMKLMYPMWRLGQVRDAVYYDARRSWNFYCKQAYGNAMMPNADQLESIKNSWLRLVPEIRENNNFFSALGQEQKIYNQNGSSTYVY